MDTPGGSSSPSSTRFCPHCGGVILDGQAYCSSCGTKVEGEPVTLAEHPAQSTQQKNALTPKQRRIIMTVSITVIVIIVAVVLTVILLSSKKPASSESTESTYLIPGYEMNDNPNLGSSGLHQTLWVDLGGRPTATCVLGSVSLGRMMIACSGDLSLDRIEVYSDKQLVTSSWIPFTSGNTSGYRAEWSGIPTSVIVTPDSSVFAPEEMWAD